MLGIFGKLPVRPFYVAGITPWIFLQVILVLFLGVPEIACRYYFSDDPARPFTGSLHFSNQFVCHILLRFVQVKNSRTIGGAHIIALPVPGCRVMDLKKKYSKSLR